ncbi:hypothetical protein ABBQ38_000100 [Trebouxia sp. C0009 RCD-2024]
MSELRQQLHDAHAASDAAHREQKEQEMRVVQMDSDLADLRRQLKSEKAARAAAFTQMEEAQQRQAAAMQQTRIEKHAMQAEVEGLKQQLAAAARQQHRLRHELRSAQQQSMTASAGNVALKTQIQATQKALAAATGGTEDAKAERMWSLNNYSVAFRDAVQKADEKKSLAEAELQSSSDAKIRQLKSVLVKLQRTIDRMIEQEGKSGPAATAKQHRGHRAAASCHSSTAETAPAIAAASKAQMGPARKVTTIQAGGPGQQGKVAAKSAAGRASSARAVASSRGAAEPQQAPARQKVTQPTAAKNSSGQVVGAGGLGTSGGIVSSGALPPKAASFPTSTINATGNQVKAQPSHATKQHATLAAKQTEPERPAEARMMDSLVGVKRKRVDGANIDACNPIRRRQKLQSAANSQLHRQPEGCIKAWK